LGRYLLFDEIGCGGMATVHLGRLLGAAGFARTVAIKRLHPQYAKDPAFVAMLVDEARLAARIRHPHVVSTLDVAFEDGELFVVMDYVDGVSMAHLQERLIRGPAPMPWRLAAFVAGQTLLGLHAAHEATSEHGEPLGIVHRDVSPHNVLVGADGVVRVADFGVAKAAARVSATPDGKFKGKLAYMAPEQLRRGAIDRRVDVFATAIVLYEALSGRRLFWADEQAATLKNILDAEIEPPSRFVPEIPAALDEVVLRGLERDPERRFPTAQAMARALQVALPMPTTLELGEWMRASIGDELEARSRLVAKVESQASEEPPETSVLPAEVGHRKPRRLEPASEGTELSSVRALPVASRSSRTWLVITLIFAALGAFVVFALVYPFRARTQHSASEPPRSAPQAPSVKDSVISATASAATPVKPLAAAPPSASSGPVLSSSVHGSSRGKPHKRRASDSAPAESARAESSSRCDPPYTLNPDGTKRFKPECF
jgi:eukaryotic-like serine/threonine-protein kinase